jgi:hypothetical protein
VVVVVFGRTDALWLGTISVAEAESFRVERASDECELLMI